jgi:hypothetical protein
MLKMRKRGDLNETLNHTLEPRLPPGRPGRPKGSGNYKWTPEMDRILEEACRKLGPAKAKNEMRKKLLETRDDPGEFKPRLDSLRNSVERRMALLGLQTGQKRKTPHSRIAKAWEPSDTTALVAAIGGDLLDESVEKRTHHTIKAARAKLARLGHAASELRGVAYTVDELAWMLHVTSRQVRRWKEKGGLKTTRRRISDKDLSTFLKNHHDLVPYNLLPRDVQVSLIDLGYPAKDAAKFRATVKSMLEDLGGGRKKRWDARAVDHPTDPPLAKPIAVGPLRAAIKVPVLAFANSA